jgi:hypothetical protein
MEKIGGMRRLLPPLNISFAEKLNALAGFQQPRLKENGLGILLMQKCITKTFVLFDTTYIKLRQPLPSKSFTKIYNFQTM